MHVRSVGRCRQRYHIKGSIVTDRRLVGVQVLAEGAEQASVAADRTLNNCREAMGFVPRRR